MTGQLANNVPDGLTYIPDFLTPGGQQELLSRLRSLGYENEFFRGRPLKRSYCQFGHAYVTAKRGVVPAAPMPDFLAALADRGLAHCPVGTAFDQCIVTRYPKTAGIGWHTDKPCFGDCILAVSLGHAARLQFRPSGTEEGSHEILAVPGSLYVMRGPARWGYEHHVTEVEAERYSITFRRVIQGHE